MGQYCMVLFQFCFLCTDVLVKQFPYFRKREFLFLFRLHRLQCIPSMVSTLAKMLKKYDMKLLIEIAA